MRFLADENVSRLVIERLRDDGHDVISVAEMKPGAPDDDILNTADADGRILITEDRDFGEMVIRQRSRYAVLSCWKWIDWRTRRRLTPSRTSFPRMPRGLPATLS